MDTPRRFKLIACEILYREICYCVSQCRHIIDVVFLPKGLHDVGAGKMSARLQEAIDQVDPTRCEAILLGYGLCNNGIQGLSSNLPMVVPRAHDCITLLLGSKETYANYFQQNPGTFFNSTGWIERKIDPASNQDSILSQLGVTQSYEAYVAQYGKDAAQYLMETLGDLLKNYKKLAYIDTNIGDFERYKVQTQQEAQERGWAYEEIQGSVSLLLDLLNGEWDPRYFLIIPPGQLLKPTYDDDIIGLT